MGGCASCDVILEFEFGGWRLEWSVERVSSFGCNTQTRLRNVMACLIDLDSVFLCWLRYNTGQLDAMYGFVLGWLQHMV